MTSATQTGTAPRCDDRVVLDQWHPLGSIEQFEVGVVYTTTLLGEPVEVTMSGDGRPFVRRTRDATAQALPTRLQYLNLWTSLGDPPDELFEVAEFYEPDRRSVHTGTIGVSTSAPRAVENFLDMGHFPFVHTNILGVEPHTEVADYQVRVDPDTNDIWATDCMFWQPMAAVTATGGQMTDYIYRVPHPYCVLLYKSCPADPERMDVIGLFCQPVAADRIRACMLMCLVDDENTATVIRRFQQTIFGQDKPILENQHPKRLPLDPRAETPIRADKVAIAYRRWLSDLGVTYGVIPGTG